MVTTRRSQAARQGTPEGHVQTAESHSATQAPHAVPPTVPLTASLAAPRTEPVVTIPRRGVTFGPSAPPTQPPGAPTQPVLQETQAENQYPRYQAPTTLPFPPYGMPLTTIPTTLPQALTAVHTAIQNPTVNPTAHQGYPNYALNPLATPYYPTAPMIFPENQTLQIPPFNHMAQPPIIHNIPAQSYSVHNHQPQPQPNHLPHTTRQTTHNTLGSTRNKPLVDALRLTPIPLGFKGPSNIPNYKGDSDPFEWVQKFEAAMT